MAITILSLIIVFIILGAIIIVTFLRLRSMAVQQEELINIRQSTAEILNSYRECCADYQQRFLMVHSHSTDYVNSLRAETTKMILQLTNLIAAQEDHIARIEESLASDNPEMCAQAALQLKGLRAQTSNSRAPTSAGSTPRLWAFEEEAEVMLQKIGQDILTASQHARELGLPRKRDRKATSIHLTEAGILDMVRNRLKDDGDDEDE